MSRPDFGRSLLLFGTLLCFLATPLLAQNKSEAGWPEWGGSLRGDRYSSAHQITEANAGQLQVAWTFHTHALDVASRTAGRTLFEATPVLWRNSLYLDTPFNVIFALDAATGAQRWTFDPGVDRNTMAYMVVSRGVALWHAQKPKPGPCGTDRVLVSTVDRRLIALDSESGKLCAEFGNKGTVDLAADMRITDPDLYFMSSPPVVVGNTIVVGSGVGDNQAVFVASGAVRGFDTVTGRLKWIWEPVRWTGGQHPTSGSGNVWSVPAADVEHDLVFLPTGSASVDFFGGLRIGNNRDADSIVALRASTGQKVWSYQLVHHDIWDYDTPSQPLLFTFHGKIPAVAVTTKTNMIFVFNRLTGAPLFPIEERPVPPSTVPGEVTWPTQPFSTLPALGPQSIRPEDIHLHNPTDQAFCREVFTHFDNKGLFTPPSLRGTIVNPGNGGGSNWGSSAFDPRSSILYTHTSSIPYLVRIVPRREAEAKMLRENPTSVWGRVLRRYAVHAPAWAGGEKPDPEAMLQGPPDKGGRLEYDPMHGTPYRISRGAIRSPDDHFCGPTPYGSMVATNLQTGQRLWSVPMGKVFDDEEGAPGNAGVIATEGGLLLGGSGSGAPFLYALSAHTGQVLWQGRLPAPAMANPMTYTIAGRQYIVIAAGGATAHSGKGPQLGDAVVAFALPASSEPTAPTHLTTDTGRKPRLSGHGVKK